MDDCGVLVDGRLVEDLGDDNRLDHFFRSYHGVDGLDRYVGTPRLDVCRGRDDLGGHRTGLDCDDGDDCENGFDCGCGVCGDLVRRRGGRPWDGVGGEGR